MTAGKDLIAIMPSKLGYRAAKPGNIVLATHEGVQEDDIGKGSMAGVSADISTQ